MMVGFKSGYVPHSGTRSFLFLHQQQEFSPLSLFSFPLAQNLLSPSSDELAGWSASDHRLPARSALGEHMRCLVAIVTWIDWQQSGEWGETTEPEDHIDWKWDCTDVWIETVVVVIVVAVVFTINCATLIDLRDIWIVWIVYGLTLTTSSF